MYMLDLVEMAQQTLVVVVVVQAQITAQAVREL
jgi:hypothetical protein